MAELTVDNFWQDRQVKWPPVEVEDYYTSLLSCVVPATLFWSATVYDADTRCLIATNQNRVVLRSLIEKPQANAGGS